MITVGLVAVLTAALTLLFATLFRGDEEGCSEKDCHRVATHERPGDYTSDGTVTTELVCRRHGGWQRA